MKKKSKPRSQKESNKAKNLPKQKSLKSGYERKVFDNHPSLRAYYEGKKYPVTLKQTWTPDIYLVLPSGVVRVIELKGYLRREARLKMEAFRVQYPDVEMCILFEADNYPQGCQTKCTAWADKHGIFWAISPDGRIPIDWLGEERL